ncbi:hypothetical protein C5167_009248 [Papaver somniferum]|uniref:Uncharacterized protein n=1 Tax=Papaver somniferum TaxID=3469 RepID=A0A4Y7K0T4_PAPSO|nr:hypothetical protein C5167_009248 [Papaver somniferum]
MNFISFNLNPLRSTARNPPPSAAPSTTSSSHDFFLSLSQPKTLTLPTEETLMVRGRRFQCRGIRANEEMGDSTVEVTDENLETQRRFQRDEKPPFTDEEIEEIIQSSSSSSLDVHKTTEHFKLFQKQLKSLMRRLVKQAESGDTSGDI